MHVRGKFIEAAAGGMQVMPVLIEPIGENVLPEVGDRKRTRVLVCVGHYLPGYKSGGPVQSIANMVTHLSPYYDFYVVTRDRDAGDVESYPGVTSNRWHRIGNSRVLYCSSVGPSILRRAFLQVQPDIICLNSFQDAFTQMAVLLRRFGALGKIPMLLAPRGEFSPGALKIKPVKKLLYRYATKLLGLHQQLLWLTSSPREKQELLQACPARNLDSNSIYIACEVGDWTTSMALHVVKEPGAVKLAFISRISEMKNLHFLLEVLREICGEVHLDLYGPIADKDENYWEKCKKLLVQLPANIKVDYQGSVDHSVVSQLLHDHHFFVLPTKGENFCHAAVESFINATPVILSDETPWTGLNEAHAGFDIPLKDTRGWVAALQKCVDMDQCTYARYLSGALEYGRHFSVEDAVRQYLAMFEGVLDLRSGGRKR